MKGLFFFQAEEGDGSMKHIFRLPVITTVLSLELAAFASFLSCFSPLNEILFKGFNTYSLVFPYYLLWIKGKVDVQGMRMFNYSAIKEWKWDSELLGLVAAIYKETGKQELYLKQKHQALEPLIAIPIFIHDFLCIHPFNDGNGRMSRLLTTLTLYQNGFYADKHISLESKIAKNKDLYYQALRQFQHGWHEG